MNATMPAPKRAPGLRPAVFMFSDMTRQPDWRHALSHRPRHVGLILRDYDHATRRQMAVEMAALCRREGRYFAIAGDRRLAQNCGAAFHCPAFMVPQAAKRGGPPGPHDSAAVHNMGELLAAKQAGFSRIFIAPVFATASHAGARPLGVARHPAELVGAAPRVGDDAERRARGRGGRALGLERSAAAAVDDHDDALSERATTTDDNDDVVDSSSLFFFLCFYASLLKKENSIRELTYDDH